MKYNNTYFEHTQRYKKATVKELKNFLYEN